MFRRIIRLRFLLLVCLLVVAALLRLRAGALLPIDYDEDDYFRVECARRSGDSNGGPGGADPYSDAAVTP